MQVREHGSAAAFLEVAETFLMANESQNSLPLGLALRVRGGLQDADRGTRLFTIEEGDVVHGAALQTPGRAVVVTAMGEAATRCLAAELPGHLEDLIGCNGPVKAVDLLADLWASAGLGELHVHASLRLFELTELIPPAAAKGCLRLATAADFELCQRWLYRFAIDCNLPESTPGQLPERVEALEQERLFLWEVDGEAVSFAAWNRPLPHCITIGPVYTPDELRGRGYASQVVGALTAGLLDGGLGQPPRSCVILYTDLANPTSNSIYRKLGYKPIGDHRMHLFKE